MKNNTFAGLFFYSVIIQKHFTKRKICGKMGTIRQGDNCERILVRISCHVGAGTYGASGSVFANRLVLTERHG